MSGWNGRCAYGPLFDRMRRAVFEVYGYRCIGCGQQFGSQRLHAHHVAAYRYPCGAAECTCGSPKIAFGDLVPVCTDCHRAIEAVKRRNRRNGLPQRAGRPVDFGNFEVDAFMEPDDSGILCWFWKHRSGWSGDLGGGDDNGEFYAHAWRSDHRESDGGRDWHAYDEDPFKAINMAIEAATVELDNEGRGQP